MEISRENRGDLISVAMDDSNYPKNKAGSKIIHDVKAALGAPSLQ